jgi:hypothetical protein
VPAGENDNGNQHALAKAKRTKELQPTNGFADGRDVIEKSYATR